MPSQSPKPKKKPSTLSFAEAIEQIQLGERVTKKAWNDESVFCHIHLSYLCIHIDGESRQWLVSQRDMIGDDWVVLE